MLCCVCVCAFKIYVYQLCVCVHVCEGDKVYMYAAKRTRLSPFSHMCAQGKEAYKFKSKDPLLILLTNFEPVAIRARKAEVQV